MEIENKYGSFSMKWRRLTNHESLTNSFKYVKPMEPSLMGQCGYIFLFLLRFY